MSSDSNSAPQSYPNSVLKVHARKKFFLLTSVIYLIMIILKYADRVSTQTFRSNCNIFKETLNVEYSRSEPKKNINSSKISKSYLIEEQSGFKVKTLL